MLDEHLGYVADATRLELFKSAVAASLPPGAIAGGWRGEAVPPEFHWLDGLAGWFECELAEGVWMTNSPLADNPIRRPQAFLPIGEAMPVLRDHPGLYPTAAEISRFVFQVLGRDAE